ncbi:MAG: acetate/propionate family kinase, partial [Myxococcota bacterium]
MHILVLNCGSSSVKSAIIDHSTGRHVVEARIDRLLQDEAQLKLNGAESETCPGGSHAAALEAVLPRMLALLPDGVTVTAVGHRVVHGGERFVKPTVITAEVEAAIEGLIGLAPLHNPANLAGIRAARAELPDVPHVAVFDTAFHATLPARAKTYALPQELSKKHGLRRYGFHGISHIAVAD